jgi:hypothetical protein
MEVKRQARQERQVVQVGSIHEKLSGDCCHTCHTCLFFLYNFYNTPSFPMENTHFGEVNMNSRLSTVVDITSVNETIAYLP